MWAELVVVVAPVGDHHLGLGEAGEQLDREQLVTDPGVERFDVGVLPRRSGLDVGRPGTGESAPVAQRVRRELRAVVTTNELRGPAANGDEPLERDDSAVSVDASFALHLQRLARELVNDVQQLHDPPVSGLVELEVKRPHLVRALRPQTTRRHRRLTQTLALAAALRDPEAFLAPHALCALAVQHPAVLE